MNFFMPSSQRDQDHLQNELAICAMNCARRIKGAYANACPWKLMVYQCCRNQINNTVISATLDA